MALYILFLLISVVPTFIDALNPADPEGRRFLWAIFGYLLTTFINPIVTMGIILAFFTQWKKASCLSNHGLAAQAVVFFLVALSWVPRVSFIHMDLGKIPPQAYVTWYQLVGWAAVDNAVFALVQFVLLCLAEHEKRKSAARFAQPEEAPLIQPEEEPLLGS